MSSESLTARRAPSACMFQKNVLFIFNHDENDQIQVYTLNTYEAKKLNTAYSPFLNPTGARISDERFFARRMRARTLIVSSFSFDNYFLSFRVFVRI